KCRAVLMVLDVPMGRVEHDSIVYAGAAADADGTVIEPSPAGCADQIVADDRVVDYAQEGPPVADKGDERAKEIAARDEAFGPVDWVYNPLIRRGGPVMAEFLAQDAVIGVAPGDFGAHDFFGAAVGNGDRGEIFLEIHLHVAAEVGANDFGAELGELPRKGHH